MAYFVRTGSTTYRATEHVGGAWNVAEQHIAPALGLLAHLVEVDRERRREDGLVLGRLAYDILGTVPVAECDTLVEVLRPGRTIELVEARLTHAGRDVVLLRAWLMQTRDTAALAGGDLPSIPPPTELEPWDPTTVWPGDFIGSVELRRRQQHPGRAAFWVRSRHDLVADTDVSPTAAAVGLFDIANGMTPRVDPGTVIFPNLDLTAHLFREAVGDWVGFDTSVTFGPAGVGVTSTVLHDTAGPLGTMNQVLTVRPG